MHIGTGQPVCHSPDRLVCDMSTLRLIIDPVACDAYGYCAELLPEAISLDEWGYPIIEKEPLRAELIAAAKRAVRDCPRNAISLRMPSV